MRQDEREHVESPSGQDIIISGSPVELLAREQEAFPFAGFLRAVASLHTLLCT